MTNVKKNLYLSLRMVEEVKRLSREYGVGQNYVIETAFWLCKGRLEDFLRSKKREMENMYSKKQEKDLFTEWLKKKLEEVAEGGGLF